MLTMWSLLLVQIATPALFFFHQSLPLSPPQAFLGIFGSDYKQYYDGCIEKSNQQSDEITRLTATLREAETKLNDVDVYRASLEERESVLESREASMESRQSAIDDREEQLERRIFDFTTQLEKVSKNGGRSEQIIADNEILKARVQKLEQQLSDERELSREVLREEREYSRKLLDRAGRNNQVLLFVGVVIVILGLSIIGGIVFFYFGWINRRADTSQRSFEPKPVVHSRENEALPPT